MRGDETFENASLEDWQKQRIMLKLRMRGHNQITAEFALLSVNYESVEAAHIYISESDPDSNKKFHSFLQVNYGPPLCAICRLDREQHLDADKEGPQIQ
jgi:hypothetical protein